MSLINDALKRARQDTAPPPDETLALRPAQVSSSRRGPDMLPVLAAAGLIFVGFILAWAAVRGRGERNDFNVRAAAPSAVPASTAKTGAKEEAMVPSPPETTVAIEPKNAHTPAADASPAAPVIVPQTNSIASAETSISTNAVAVPEIPPAKPAFKLQVIVFDPRRPSAMISGKTLFVGDRIEAFRVVAINQDSVVLTAGNEKKVLNLSQ
jgi:hypothetical protein